MNGVDRMGVVICRWQYGADKLDGDAVQLITQLARRSGGRGELKRELKERKE